MQAISMLQNRKKTKGRKRLLLKATTNTSLQRRVRKSDQNTHLKKRERKEGESDDLN